MTDSERQDKKIIDLDGVVRLANVRFVALLCSITCATWILSEKLNTIDRRIASAITFDEFAQWQESFQNLNRGSGIIIPNMAIYHRASVSKQDKKPQSSMARGNESAGY